MPEFFDYNPHNGVSYYFDHDEATNETRITYEQDFAPILDYAKALRNDGATDRGIKESWWKYAVIPPVVMVKLHAKGIDINDPGATKRIIQEINEHYPALKTTEKKDSGKAAQLFVPK
jgi:hypothetical protein